MKNNNLKKHSYPASFKRLITTSPICQILLMLCILLGMAACTPLLTSAIKLYNHVFPKDMYGNQVIVKNSYCSLVDADGNTIIPDKKYIYIKPLNYDRSCDEVLYKAETEDGIDLYDAKGTQISNVGTTDFYGCTEGLINVRKGDFSGIIDTKGKEIIPADYEFVSIEKDGLFVAANNDKKGVINTDDKMIIPFRYNRIDVVNRDSIYVYTGERDSIMRGSRESYELDAYFSGELTKNVERFSRITPSKEGEEFKIVEQMPRFPGCEDEAGTNYEKKKCAEKEMLMYIYKNIKYPTLARIHGIEGMAVVQFVVEKDGSISNHKIIRDVKGGCGDAALKIVKTMPTWIPGYQRDKPVRVQFNLPVRFKLEG